MSEELKPRELRFDPETQRKRYLVDMFEKGLSDKRNTIGYHATSIESIQYLIKSGHLPVAQVEELFGEHDAGLPQQGDLYFVPRKSKFLNYNPDVVKFFPEEDRISTQMEVYAREIGSVHSFLTALNLTVGNSEYRDGAQTLVSGMHRYQAREFRELLHSLGITDEQIDEALIEAKERHGVVLGLRSSLLKKHKVKDGDIGAGDMRINIPSGMDYRSISGIQTFGRYEHDFFLKMKQDLPH